MIKTFDTTIEFYSPLNFHCLTISESILDHFWDDESSKFSQRFIITVNNQVTWRSGSLSYGNRRAYISISKSRLLKLGAKLGDQISVTLEKDTSEFGMEVPEEFSEVLRQDEQANICFKALTKGIQRALIQLISTTKSSQKRIEKSIFFLENLKRFPEGKATMRNILGKE